MKNQLFLTLIVFLILSVPVLAQEQIVPPEYLNDFEIVEVDTVKIGDSITLEGVIETHAINEETGETIAGIWSKEHYCFFLIKFEAKGMELFALKDQNVTVSGVVSGVLGEHYQLLVTEYKIIK